MKTLDTFSQIKDLLQKIGGRYIIVEDGRPVCVVAGFEDWQKIVHKNRENKNPSGIKNLSEKELIEKINEDITLWKEAQEEKKMSQFVYENRESNEMSKLRYIEEDKSSVLF